MVHKTILCPMTYPLIPYMFRHKVIITITFIVREIVERKRTVIPLLIIPKHLLTFL
jgi:hypothetical protein